jgi:ketosteroid isomerase-like protein
MSKTTVERTALLFNDAINAQDLDALERLMTADHRFVDGDGSSIDGRTDSLAAWESFFEAFPDYRNHFDLVITLGDHVVIKGSSTCRDPRLAGPALWSALVVEGRVSEWRIHDEATDAVTDLSVS